MKLDGSRREVMQRFGRFLLVGLLNTAFGYAVFALLLWLGLSPQPALIIAFSIGVMWNYLTTARFVFGSTGFSKLPAYVLAYLSVYLANASALQVMLSRGVDPFVAQAILTPVVAVLSFLLLSLVFRQSGKES